MNQETNPYSPGAGVIPPELVGRDILLSDTEIAFKRILNGKSERSVMFYGLRGVGKTVLLNVLQKRAKKFNAITIYHEVKSSDYSQSWDEINKVLNSVRFMLENKIGIFERIVNLPKKFLQYITGNYKISVEIPSKVRVNAERKDQRFEDDLTDIFVNLGEFARDRRNLIVILIDEIQDLNLEVNQALISAIHRSNQINLPILIIGAGLPNLVENSVNSKSYVERLFKFQEVGSLEAKDAKNAIIQPALKNGVKFDEEAANEIFMQTKGYPYFIQTWGFYTWSIALKSPITSVDVQSASKNAISDLDESFFKARFAHLTDLQKRYIKAIASLESNQPLTREVAKKMGQTTGKLCEIKNQLVKKGIIYCPESSRVSFSVPLFDDYLNQTEF